MTQQPQPLTNAEVRMLTVLNLRGTIRPTERAMIATANSLASRGYVEPSEHVHDRYNITDAGIVAFENLVGALKQPQIQEAAE